MNDIDLKNQIKKENLKLYIDSKRKDLDIILTTTIPTQKRLMKTILWLNVTILGVCFTCIYHKVLLMYCALPFTLSSVAIYLILSSLRDGRVKSFGTPELEKMFNQKKSINALILLSKSIKTATEANSEIVKKRADKISISTNLTIVSAISVFLATLCYANYLMKGG